MKKVKIKNSFVETEYMQSLPFPVQKSITINYEDNTTIKAIIDSIYNYKNFVDNISVFNEYATLFLENKMLLKQ